MASTHIRRVQTLPALASSSRLPHGARCYWTPARYLMRRTRCDRQNVAWRAGGQTVRPVAQRAHCPAPCAIATAEKEDGKAFVRVEMCATPPCNPSPASVTRRPATGFTHNSLYPLVRLLSNESRPAYKYLPPLPRQAPFFIILPRLTSTSLPTPGLELAFVPFNFKEGDSPHRFPYFSHHIPRL